MYGFFDHAVKTFRFCVVLDGLFTASISLTAMGHPDKAEYCFYRRLSVCTCVRSLSLFSNQTLSVFIIFTFDLFFCTSVVRMCVCHE